MATRPAPAPALDTASEAEDALNAYLAADRAKSLLRFVTCGSVDDGKSTLIGRLLYDGAQLFHDQVDALEKDSLRFGTQGRNLDFALLVDGLAAEREQGITIDVAYRYFASANRKYIVADAPGHEQYTRNMVTAASTADLAIILVDASQGILPQTRRHSRIVKLLGVRNVVLAVNKMDLAGHDRARFAAIVEDYAAFAAGIGLADFRAVPVVAVTGENVAHRGTAMPWYSGPTLIEALEAAPIAASVEDGGFALPVQWVSRPDAAFRGFAGTVARGGIRVGDPVTVLPGDRSSTVARIVTFDGDFNEARTGKAITLVLADQIDCAAGSTIVASDARPGTGDAIAADLVWFDEAPLVTGKSYLLQLGAQRTNAWIERIDAVAQAGTGDDVNGPTLAMNGIASVQLKTDAPVAATPYVESRALGAFVLIDRATHATVAAGMVDAITATGRTRQPSSAPVYRFPDPADADRAVAQLRTLGTPVTLLDRAKLREGVAADLPADAEAAIWRRSIAVVQLLTEAGITVALAIDPPAGSDPIGVPWPGDDQLGDWVI